MILISKPLHYKRLITKNKIHKSYCFSFCVWSIEFLFVNVFFQKDTWDKNWCFVSNNLQKIPFIFLYILNFMIFTTTLIVSYSIVTVKLYRRSRSSVTGAGTSDLNAKVTKVAWLAVSAFLVFYLPILAALAVSLLIPKPYPVSLVISSDVTYFTWLYLNNLINPFLYFATLKDFREGYKKLLGCGNNNNVEEATSDASSFRQENQV